MSALADRPPALVDPEILVRPLTHSDRPAVAFALRHLGPRSRYRRYLTAAPLAVGAPELDRLLAVDHWHHEVLIACHLAPRIPVGVCEYVRTDDFETAELAIAVADDWQRHGVGRQLLAELRERAWTAGVRRLSATVLRENVGALALLHGLGETERMTCEGPLVELVVRPPSRA
jgi:acetyltransferase